MKAMNSRRIGIGRPACVLCGPESLVKSMGFRRGLLAGVFATLVSSPVWATTAGISVEGVISGKDKTVIRKVQGARPAKIRIKRTGDTHFAQSVNYQTADGTGPDAAIAGVDYTATAGTAIIPAGQTVVSVRVPVLANSNPNSLRFSLRLGVNQGPANPAPQQLFTTRLTEDAAGPAAVVVADIDNDGKPDVVVANSSLDTVAILGNTTAVGAGAASFNAPASEATGTNPRSVALADLDGDGTLDKVVANHGSNTVSVLYSTGSVTSFSLPPGPNFVVIGEFDGDSSADIAVASDSDRVTVLAGSSGFTASYTIALSTGSAPDSLTAGDINGDGLLDLVAADFGTDSVSVVLNSGGGNFAVFNFAVGTHPTSVALADVDGDGLPDIVVAESNDNRVSVLRNTTNALATTPTFDGRQSFAGGEFPVSLAVADMDGDGKLDLLAADGGNSSLALFRNTSTIGVPSFASPQLFAASANPSAVAVGDINGDGRPDAVVSNFSSSNVSIFLNGPEVIYQDINILITPNTK